MMNEIEIVSYTEYSGMVKASEGKDLALVVQVPDNGEPVHIIIQEPKLIKFTLEEFSGINQFVHDALERAGYYERTDLEQ